MLCNNVYADGSRSPNAYPLDNPLVLERVINNVRSHNAVVTEFVDELSQYARGFSMLASFNPHLDIHRIINPFEYLDSHTLYFLDGEPMYLGMGQYLPATYLFPQLQRPPAIQDYLISVSESDSIHQSSVFYAG